MRKSWNWQSLPKKSDKYELVDYAISSSIYGWTIQYCLSGANEGKVLILGMSADTYAKYK